MVCEGVRVIATGMDKWLHAIKVAPFVMFSTLLPVYHAAVTVVGNVLYMVYFVNILQSPV